MSLKNFIKQNAVLAIGLSLPVLLIVLFFLTTALPRSLATPPQYELLFSVTDYSSQNPAPYIAAFVVREGILKGRAGTDNRSFIGRKLMSYDAKTESVREIVLDSSKIAGQADGSEITFDETKRMKIDTSNKAPDGYIFEGPSYTSGGLIPELFMGWHQGRAARVKKGMTSYKIPHIPNNYYADIQFIGWVVEKNISGVADD